MKKTAVILFLSLLSFQTFGQTRRERKKAISEFKDTFYGTIQDAPFRQRIHFQNIKDHIFIKVLIHGKEYTFGYDTGALTVISEQLRKELDLESVGKVSIVDANSTRNDQQVYKIDELKLGDVTFNNTGCVSANLDELTDRSCIKIDGLFGINMIRHCFWKINMSDSIIELSDKLPALQPGSTALNFGEAVGGYIYLKVNCGKKEFYVEFDSGSGDMLKIPDSLFVQTDDYKSGHYVTGSGVTGYSLYGASTSAEHETVTSLLIDNVPFDHVAIKGTPATLRLLGTPFIKDRETILDWDNHKIYLAPAAGAASENTLGMGLNMVRADNKLVVAFLWKGSSADKAGVQLGDEITAVNGMDTRIMTHDMYCGIINLGDAPEMEITVKHLSGTERKCKLVRAALIK